MAPPPAPKPRVLRFTFGMQNTSTKPAEDVLDEVKRVLAANSVSYRATEPFLLVCTHGSVQFEMEVRGSNDWSLHACFQSPRVP